MCKPGMVFTIEPMINAGSHKDVTWPDDWTSTTSDGKRSAQFEHTLLVTDTGVEVLTARTAQSAPLFWESASDHKQPASTDVNGSTPNNNNHVSSSNGSVVAAPATDASTTATTTTTAAAKKSKKKKKKKPAAPQAAPAAVV